MMHCIFSSLARKTKDTWMVDNETVVPLTVSVTRRGPKKWLSQSPEPRPSLHHSH